MIAFFGLSISQTYQKTIYVGDDEKMVILEPKTIPAGYLWKITRMDEFTSINFSSGDDNFIVSGYGDSGVILKVNSATELYVDLPIWLTSTYKVYFTCLSAHYISIDVYKN